MNVNNMMVNINLNQKAVLSICIALGSLMLVTLSYAIWEWRSDWTIAHQEFVIQHNIAAADDTAQMISTIPEQHLFGEALIKVGQMPLTNLQLQVTGIVKGPTEQGSVSKAYISISGQPSKIYIVGDSLPYGVKIYDIVANAIILENKGHLEKLLLPREQLKFKNIAMKESL